MPELPEAETIARHLHEELAGRTLGHVRLTRPDVVHGHPGPLCALVRGRRVLRVHRRAKRVLLDLEGDGTLVFHLGMSGRLLCTPVEKPVAGHTHLRITLADTARELRFCDPRRFGGVWFLNGRDEGHVGRRLGPLGAEPLELTPARFARLLTGRRSIKALLLDQTVIAGMGNIYCDEALHAAGIHPRTPAGDLDREAPGRLLKAMKRTLRAAIRHGGSTRRDYVTPGGEPGSYQKRHSAYNREGQPCKTCRRPIERLVVAGRSTFVCPACQGR